MDTHYPPAVALPQTPNLAKRSAFMNQEKYIGMDVHQATISVAVMDAQGKLIMECLLETKAATIVEFIRGLQGTLSLTFEEGTSAAWLHDLLKPHVSRLVVCDPRKNALLKDGNKSDRIDARQAGGVVTRQPTPSRVPRRAWGSHLERTGAQLSDPHPRCHPRHESHQSSVPQLGDSLRRHNRLLSPSSRRVAG
jgi:transposase